jgi:hypothetical protein
MSRHEAETKHSRVEHDDDCAVRNSIASQYHNQYSTPSSVQLRDLASYGWCAQGFRLIILVLSFLLQYHKLNPAHHELLHNRLPIDSAEPV